MPTITTNDGIQLYYEDVGEGSPLQTWPRQTLLVNARWSLSNALGVSFSRGKYLASPT
jgi:hypothetical protein